MIGHEALKMQPETLTKIVRLNLGMIDMIVEGNNIRGPGVKELTRMLKNNTTLTYLNLSIHLLLL